MISVDSTKKSFDSAEAVVYVKRQFKPSPKDEWKTTEDSQTIIGVHRYITAPAHIGVGVGRTVNLGDFASWRCDIRVEIPCYREEVEQAYVFARDFGVERLEQELSKLSTANQAPPPKKPKPPSDLDPF